MSHTVSLDIKLKNKEAVIKAAQAMGATIEGEGTHRLFSSSHTGLLFKLPKWSYGIVVDKEGNTYYDNYGGAWGNPADLETLKEKYAQEVVASKCDELGWYYEKNGDEIVVHHPAGGTITVQKGGSLDAVGFHGTSCSEATLPLEQALGSRLGETLKPEMNETQINAQIIED